MASAKPKSGAAGTQKARLNWAAIEADPRFRALHRKKNVFLWGWMIAAVVYYFLLPIGAAYFPGIFNRQVWGPVNVGLLFALSQFVVAWFIAALYSRKAGRDFDPLAQDIAKDSHKFGA
ncbi:DUF485 domain-containing protein [Thermithiobacillus plumbiphilus]|uniref:DUF485 domain-containing protein n=1 Tax=Thermithiobacillus plumbiphilus TaxID=1729899 RepID=A0ABU9D9C7_9PROT